MPGSRASRAGLSGARNAPAFEVWVLGRMPRTGRQLQGCPDLRSPPQRDRVPWRMVSDPRPGVRLMARLLKLTLLSALLPGVLAAEGGFQGAPPKNLQVLPKDLTREEVVGRMRLIAASLGVRCEFCHVRTTGPDGRQIDDDASDDKDTKKTAREMMKMVNAINDQ